jgi:uncharacterized membrane protein HdeD (DUF308 family)
VSATLDWKFLLALCVLFIVVAILAVTLSDEQWAKWLAAISAILGALAGLLAVRQLRMSTTAGAGP